MIGIDGIDEQQRNMMSEAEVAVFLTSADRVDQDVTVVAADPDRAGVDRAVAVEAGHAGGDGFIEQRKVAGGEIVEGSPCLSGSHGE
jgi:hypothetical protein